MRFDLVDLRLFVHVVEAGSITHGAKRGHIALAAASARLRQLEERLGSKLLERSKKGALPTAAGRTLLYHARHMLARAGQLEGDMAEFSGAVRGRIRLSVNALAMDEFVPESLGRFLVSNPDLVVDLQVRQSFEIIRDLAEQATDVGIIAGVATTPRIHCVAAPGAMTVLVAPQAYPLADGQPVSFETLLDEWFVAVTEPATYQDFLDQAAARLSGRLRLRARLPGFDGVLRLVEAGAGLAVVPAAIARRYAATMRLRVVELADAWARCDMSVCTRIETEPGSPESALAEHFARSADGPPAHDPP